MVVVAIPHEHAVVYQNTALGQLILHRDSIVAMAGFLSIPILTFVGNQAEQIMAKYNIGKKHAGAVRKTKKTGE